MDSCGYRGAIKCTRVLSEVFSLADGGGGIVLVFADAGEGIAEAAKAVRVERRGRDVYIIGAANVGKSAFVRWANHCWTPVT